MSKNKSLIVAIIFLLSACAPDDDQKRTEAIIHDYLMNNPDIVSEIIDHAAKYKNRHEESQKAQMRKQVLSALTFTGPGSFAQGQGDITLVAFFDYQCGYCKKSFAPMMRALKKDKAVRLVLKEFPILGDRSRHAARAAIAAQKQGLYLKFHTALMTTPGQISERKTFQIAQRIGINSKKLRQDMESQDITKAIAENMALAKKLSITGTPVFILINKDNAHFAPGARDEKEFTQLFKQARNP